MYQPVIGLEIHIELKTRTKMFCSSRNDPDEIRPNVNICPVCMGHPGTLPVINREAVRKTIKTGLALNCEIPSYSKFDRKNYFYPDLPKGYQISQYDMPLCKGGFLEINGKKIKIERVHLEEDTGRLIHEKDYSLVDFNRAGVPLMELVTEPDLSSASEVRKFVEELQLILRYLGVSDANMEKGQLRVEVNISLQPKKSKKMGTKVEIKNLNSLKGVEKSIDYEIKRQTKILENRKKVLQETRGWDEIKEMTRSQREKEYAHDYRYFPEPDLPPLNWSKDETEEIKNEIPELPQKRRERLKKEYKLSEEEAQFFVINKNFGEYFEKIISELPPSLSTNKLSRLTKLTSNYLTTDLQGLFKGAPALGEDFLITPENFAEFITLIDREVISSKTAKLVLNEMFRTGKDPSNIIEEKGLSQIVDKALIEKAVKEVVVKNPKPVKDFKEGKKAALQFLIGQVMAKTRGRAKPEMVSKILKEFLS